MLLYLPYLSPGRHLLTRTRANLMEFVSLLAGERWSSFPSCTHPVLASLALSVNDSTPEPERHLLAPLAPLLIGTSCADEECTLRLVLHVLDEVFEEVDSSIPLESSRLLARRHLGLPPLPASPLAVQASELVPSRVRYLRHGAPRTAGAAAELLAQRTEHAVQAERLRALLRSSLLLAASFHSPSPASVDERWDEALSLLGSRPTVF